MNATLEQMIAYAAELSPQDRAELAEYLLESLQDEKSKTYHEEWIAVAQERLEEIKIGKAVGIPAEEVLRTLLEPRR